MSIKNKRKIIAGGILLFFITQICIPCSPGAIRQTTGTDISSTQTGTITCYLSGANEHQRQKMVVSADEAAEIFERLQQLNTQMTKDPYSQKTEELKIAFINLLDEKGALPAAISQDALLSLLNPAGVAHYQGPRKQTSFPQPFPNRGTSVVCSIGGEGSGLLIPLFLIPRPRFIMLWIGNGISMATNMLTTRGYYAGGVQTGLSLGFMGIGLSYSLPGYSMYGFIGYALLATTTAEYMEYYPPNRAPEISDVSPGDGTEDVPLATSELQFRISDADGDLMSYTVTTNPDIGSASGNLKPFGRYTVPLSNLQNDKIYRWTIQVSDGKETRTESGCFFTVGKGPFDPFTQGWSYRKKITIDHTKVSGDLVDFPMLLTVTDPDIRDKAQDDGDDILFMNQAGVATQLYHEIEDFNGATGQFTAWVRLPSISSTQDIVLYMYYGNASSIAQQIPEKVWGTHFKAVWHLNTNPLDLVLDSTAKDHDGVAEGDMTSSDLLMGKIGRCLHFDGVDDLISFSEFTDSLNTGTCTAWVQTTSTTIGTVWGEASSNNNKPYILLGKYTDDLLTYARDIYGLDSNYQGRVSTGMNNGQWHHVAWISKGSGSGNTFYFDGQPVSLSWQDGQNPNGIWFDDQTTDTHSIGGLDRSLRDCQWAGTLDEIRLLDTPLSSAWVATEYTNHNAPSSFVVFGAEESHP